MLTYQITFKEQELEQVKALLQFVRTLSFVEVVKEVEAQVVVEEEEAVAEIEVEKEAVDIEAIEGVFLPIEDIRALYPDSWVVLKSPKYEGTKIVGGIVLVHGKDKYEVSNKALEIRKEGDIVNLIYTTIYKSENPVWLRNIPLSEAMKTHLSK
ncbi:MAG: hypothetical protein R3E32_25565 [Chitinophagales bacterium]